MNKHPQSGKFLASCVIAVIGDLAFATQSRAGNIDAFLPLLYMIGLLAIAWGVVGVVAYFKGGIGILSLLLGLVCLATVIVFNWHLCYSIASAV